MQDNEKSVHQIDDELAQLRQQVAELQGQTRALKSECYQLRTLIDHLPDYIFIKDTESRFVINNAAHIRLMGYTSQEDLTGKTDYDMFPKELAEPYYTDEQAVMQSGEPLIDREEETVTPEGKRQWLSTTKVALRDPDNKIIGLVGMSRDITPRKKAEEALEKAFAELEKITYMVSYDMQRPLQEVVQDLHRLQERLGDRVGDVSIGIITSATQATQRVQRLNNDLMAYSRIETWGSLHEPTDSQVVVEHAVDSLSERIERHQGVVTHDDLPVVLADPAQLLTVFQIMVSNAIDYRSEATPRIHISAQPHNGMWRFTIRDNGIGIDPKYTDQIFDIFERLHDQHEHPGTGIGLATCRKIVHYHQGEIGVESKPGEGSTFYFTLPAVEDGE